MSEKLDELSITIGRILSNQENLDKKFENHIPLLHKKIDKLNKEFSSLKIKVAYISGGAAAIMTLLMGYLKGAIGAIVSVIHK